jgi:hypothetical protein
MNALPIASSLCAGALRSAPQSQRQLSTLPSSDRSGATDRRRSETLAIFVASRLSEFLSPERVTARDVVRKVRRDEAIPCNYLI